MIYAVISRFPKNRNNFNLLRNYYTRCKLMIIQNIKHL